MPRLVHQLRPGTELPICIANINVPEIGGQDRQKPLGILARAVPLHERHHSKSMPEIVETWSLTRGRVTQTDLPRDRVERFANVANIQTISAIGDEDVR